MEYRKIAIMPQEELVLILFIVAEVLVVEMVLLSLKPEK
jgi:hypothetical protein